MNTDFWDYYISPVFNWMVAIVFLVAAVLAMFRPGGFGAVVLLLGSVGQFVCATLHGCDTLFLNVLGRELFSIDSWFYAVLYLCWDMSIGVQSLGFLLVILAIGRVWKRNRELELLAARPEL